MTYIWLRYCAQLRRKILGCIGMSVARFWCWGRGKTAVSQFSLTPQQFPKGTAAHGGPIPEQRK